MKYGIVIIDGVAGQPVPQLGNRTPLPAARTPAMDGVARRGRLGTAWADAGDGPVSGTAAVTALLGYNPATFPSGTAGLEALALGVPVAPGESVFRLDLVTAGEEGSADDGRLIALAPGTVNQEQTAALLQDLQAWWARQDPPPAASVRVHPARPGWGLVVDSSGRTYAEVTTTDPAAVDSEWERALPYGEGPAKASADALCRLMELGAEMLPRHAINQQRRATGLAPINMCWLWGQGPRPALPGFAARFGLRGAMATATDAVAGLAGAIGWDVLTHGPRAEPGVIGRCACEALGTHDIVCCHVRMPEAAAGRGWKRQVETLEEVDQLVVAPMVERLAAFGEAERGEQGARVLIATTAADPAGEADADAPPMSFAMAGSFIRAVRTGPFDEAHAATSDLRIRKGYELMEFFLSGGRVAVRGAGSRSGAR